MLGLKAALLNSGTLTLRGTFDVSALTPCAIEGSSSYVDAELRVSTSGFATSGGFSVTVIAGGTVQGDEAVITHGGDTLTLGANGIATGAGRTDYSTYYLNGSDAVTTSAIHGVSGAAGASVVVRGGSLTVDDVATVNATGGTLELVAGGVLRGSLSGAVLSATDGELHAAFSGYNGMVGHDYALTSVLNNSGTLTLSGTFDVSGLTLATTAATHIDTAGQSGTSGFAREASYSVTLATGTTANAGATISHGDIRLTLGTDGTATAGGAVDYSTYYLTGTDAATTTAIHGVSSTAVVSMNGGTLTVDDTATVNATGGTLALAGGTLNGTLSGTTISATRGDIKATLTGANTITGNNYALTSVLDNHGTLTLSGTFDVSGLIPGAAVTPSGFVGVDGNTSTSGFAVGERRSVTLASGTTVDQGATITDGVFTYQLGTDGTATYGGGTDYSTYHLSGSDTATTSAIHGVSATAVVSMNGGTLTVDDAATVNATGGALALTGGALNGTLSGTTISATSGDINATFEGNNSIIGNDYALTSVLNNSGTLTMSGTFDVSGLTLATTDATHIDTTGQSGTSGFAREASYSVTLATGTTVNAGATVSHGDIRLTLGTDGTATAGGAVDYSTYYLTGTDAATTSAIHGMAGADRASVTMDGGTLTVDDAATVYATGGALSLEGGELDGTIANTSLTAHDGRIRATLTGQTSLLVDGGTVALSGGNSHSGGSVISGGSVVLDGRGALGIGDVSLKGGRLDLGGHQLDVSGSLTLAGGSLVYRGEQLVVRATEGVVFEGGTTIEVAPDECQHGLALVDFGDTSGYSEGALTLVGAGEGWTLSFDETSGILTLLNTALPVVDSVRPGLDGNQRGAYDALKAAADDEKVGGELGRLAALVQQEKDPAAVASVLDQVNGAALAVAMSSQVEGNLAHLRRLRQNIGSGQAFDAAGRVRAYVSALNADQRLDADGTGRGYRRTEWGGMFGIEGKAKESMLLGFALSQSSARLQPTGEARSREYITRLDAYAAVEMGSGWQSLTSVGYGGHSFDLHRQYLGGQMVKAEGVNGSSFNLMEEVNYTMSAGEKGSLQPFFAVEMSVNHLDGFDETGAGNASLHGESRSAWATELTLGTRYQYRFAALEKAPEATLSVQGGVVASVGDTTSDLSLNYQGAPERKFTVRTADRNRWGYQVSVMLTLPVTPEAAFYAGGGAVMHGDSHEADAQMGVRLSF